MPKKAQDADILCLRRLLGMIKYSSPVDMKIFFASGYENILRQTLSGLSAVETCVQFFVEHYTILLAWLQR